MNPIPEIYRHTYSQSSSSSRETGQKRAREASHDWRLASPVYNCFYPRFGAELLLRIRVAVVKMAKGVIWQRIV